MKKYILIMAGLLLASGTTFAQDKEALKAQKAAQKEAEALVKKAKSTYDTSIANPQYGRKETDYAKLDGALPLIQEAVKNPLLADDYLTWKTATDIEFQYYLKLENEVKADESAKPKFIECASRVAEYAQNANRILEADTKMKPEEKKLNHVQLQNMAINPAIQLLQAAQSGSNADAENQAELKNGYKYSSQFLDVMASPLMKDFSNENLNEWLTYAKAFKAQSLLNIQGSSEADIVAAYKDLMPTKYKGIAYQSLANYYREKDPAKQNQIFQEGIEALKGDADQQDLRANFAIILMQNQFQAKDVEGFKKTAELIKTEFADNENAINAYLMEGQMKFEAQDYEGAKQIFLEAAKAYPSESKGLVMAARSAWMKAQAGGSKKADMDEAIKLFKELESKYPDEPENWGESLYILYNNTQQAALAAPYKKYYKAM